MTVRMLGLAAILAALVACGGPDCTSAADCKGVLPGICQVCTDGQTACAHFACVAGRCETQILCPWQEVRTGSRRQTDRRDPEGVCGPALASGSVPRKDA